MKITFLSNFYNHHQMPLSRSLNKHLNGDYSFIATIPMDSERKIWAIRKYRNLLFFNMIMMKMIVTMQ